MVLIDMRTVIEVRRVKLKIIPILGDKHLSKFMMNYHPKLHEALRDFQEFGTYPYMCSLRFVIDAVAPAKGGRYMPAIIDNLARSIDYITSLEAHYRAKGA